MVGLFCFLFGPFQGSWVGLLCSTCSDARSSAASPQYHLPILSLTRSPEYHMLMALKIFRWMNIRYTHASEDHIQFHSTLYYILMVL